MYERHIIGKKGEEIAVDYLKSIGYTIIERNFLCRQGEIDVIALDNKYIVIIEIKSRTNQEYGLPSEAVTKTKLKHILKTAAYYLHVKKMEDANVRIDVVEVYVKENRYYINHLKQII